MTLDDLKNLKGSLDLTITVDEQEHEVTTEEAIHKMAVDVVAGMYGSGTNRKEYLYKAIQSEVNKIVGG